MPDIKIVTIEWTGPYSFDDLHQDETEGVLYMITGRRRGPSPDAIQYVGKTKNDAYTRMSQRDHTEMDARITQNSRKYWIGRPKRRFHENYDDILQLMEHLIIRHLVKMNEIDNRYVELLNQRKTQTNPTQSIGALNVWFKTNGEPYSIEFHTANQLLHDIIIYDGEQFICAPTMKRID